VSAVTDPARPWRELHEAHRATRERDVAELKGAVQRRLDMLVKRGHLAPETPYRFSEKAAGGILVLGEQMGAVGLDNLADLTEAKLTVLAKLDRRRRLLHQFTAMVEGTAPDGVPWMAAVHLDDDSVEQHAGTGACGHASWHCHVGRGWEYRPEVRVPFPAVGAPAALDWLLTQIVAEHEPAPWLASPAT
jgi:hypothetical protein